MGTLLAWGMYKIVKSVEYQTVNPGQDFDDHEAKLFHPPSNPNSAQQVERPNVAAIAAEQAVRDEAIRVASRSSEGGSPVATRLQDAPRTEHAGGAHGVRD